MNTERNKMWILFSLNNGSLSATTCSSPWTEESSAGSPPTRVLSLYGLASGYKCASSSALLFIDVPGTFSTYYVV